MTPVGGEQVCSFLSVTQEYSSFDKVVLISGRVILHYIFFHAGL